MATGTYLIAELGSCHDGQYDRARNLIYRAKEAGADAAKFQMFRADSVCQKRNAWRYWAAYHAYEMPDWWLPKLADVAKEVGIDFLCTAYDTWGLETVDPFVAMHKISSFEAHDSQFVAQVLDRGKHVIMSTGMMSLADLRRVLEHQVLDSLKYLLHCTSAYPAPIGDANLLAMSSIKGFGAEVGLSDHTPGITCPVAAVALGARCIEKHVTDDRNRPGPDHSISIEFADFARMAKMVREVEQALGDGDKRLQPSEQEMVKYAVTQQ